MVKGFLTNDDGVGACPSGGARGGGGHRGASPATGGDTLRSGMASVDSEDFTHFASEPEVGREFDIGNGARITNSMP
jgi:hypothetical protein